MKAGALIICAVIVILLMPGVLSAVNDFRMTDQTDEFNVSIGDDTEDSVTLSQDLYDDETRNAAITSNLTTDAPIASTYTTATNALLVTGLTGNTTRRLTIVYKLDALSAYTGAAIVTKVWPMMLILGSLAIIVAAVAVAANRRGE